MSPLHVPVHSAATLGLLCCTPLNCTLGPWPSSLQYHC